ncbi:uncharacterized protein Z519_00305 [Cladophialophora bantiana CBS 173.52]|uniref:Peptidase S8/S53 domain-containing protein n=1 Tax=Cladophialophora bantiana (strain ATCC 10958 / CBS 173.52 / CDC B-1940 / NIH 8579) TaxID=1442370 RepID=A0A0D2IPD6_CLAB1|nr:uncharacterized protein Z519_00305 [Cladophialophora bantiana CBS 173.52]KIW98644.1 hypothetical protein Z519_00305 [Cladophialophora bantiana CBS 173.52]
MKIKNLQRVQSGHMSVHGRHDTQGMTGGDEDDLLMELKEIWDDLPDDINIRATLQEIKTRILRRELQVDNEEQLRAFMASDDADYVGFLTDKEQENFLHMMASDTQNRCLIKFLAEERSQLMFGTDRSMYYPLHVAIKEKNTDFITAVLDSKFSETDDMKKVLSHKGGSNPGNCIHIGIQVGLDPQLIIRLIEKSDGATLSEQDGAGLTPLHCAVDYKNCRKGQFEVVQALLKHGDAALDKEGSIHGSLSPYRYHDETKKIEKKKLEEAEWAKRQNDGRGSQQPRVGTDNRGVRDPSHYQDAGQADLRKSSEDDREDAKERKNMIDLDPRVYGMRRQSNAIRANSVGSRVRSPTSDVPAGGGASTPPPTIDRVLFSPNPNPANLGRPRKAMRASRPGAARRSFGSQRLHQPEAPPDDETADEIAKELKLHYLRSIFKGSAYSGSPESVDGDRPELRNHDRAVRFLYGDNKENRHICFNFLDGPSKMTADKFRTTYGGFKFDHVLQYVGFRRLEFTVPELPPRGSGTMSKSPASTGRGRRDMEVPFNWLHDKGVTNIIKVIVDDLEPPSHKDESIQNALKKFDIEILDWRKIDLCPDTICRSCPNLREVHLWWSGNNGILRAWSEPEGLARLERLEAIQLHQTQELESESWTDMNIATFRKRLRDLRNAQNGARKPGDKLPQIRVPDPIKAIDGPAQRPAGSHPKTDFKVQRETHKWLHIMDTFADGIYKIKPDRDVEFFEYLPPELQSDVKVALIDDGVQFTHESLQEKIDDGWSFDDGYDGVDLPGARRPFHESSTGHGTLMANMICRICPNAKIFVCRLNVYPGDGTKSHFSAKSAADAAVYCATRGFDIILMSWTIRKSIYTPDSMNDGKDLDRLERALDEACKNGALLFCAAPDEGGISDEKFRTYYPVGCDSLSSRIFKIGAATSTNKEADRTGKSSQLDFILPGHEVRERGSDTVKVDDSLKSGSSVATALAAGLAALVIHCVRLGAIETIRARTTKRNGDARKSGGDTTSEDGAKAEDNTNEDMRTALEAVAIKLEDFADIKKFEHMMRVFASIPRQRKAGETWKYLEVDNTFEGPGKTLVNKEAGESQKILAVTKLAMNFVSSGLSKL